MRELFSARAVPPMAMGLSYSYLRRLSESAFNKKTALLFGLVGKGHKLTFLTMDLIVNELLERGYS